MAERAEYSLMPDQDIPELQRQLAETRRQLHTARGENAALRAELEAVSRRLDAAERSLALRAARAAGVKLNSWKQRGGQALLRSPLHEAYRRLTGPRRSEGEYRKWLQRHRAQDPLRGEAGSQTGARISVLMATRDPNPDWLRAAVESVAKQTLSTWELCVCVDGSAGDVATAFLDRTAAEDPRVKVLRGPGEGISGALNRAMAAATGDWLAFLDHDDALEPTALAHVSRALEAGSADLLYTDEGYIDAKGQEIQSNFKPGWSPELLLRCMYMGHLLVARRTLVAESGGLRSGFDGSQDYDLVLRLSGRGARVLHVPRVLYHWRRHEGSTAESASAKPWAEEAGLRALQEEMGRRGMSASVTHGSRPNVFELRTDGRGKLVSVVVPTRNAEMAGRCLGLLKATAGGQSYEAIVVRHLQDAIEDGKIGEVAAAHTARVVDWSGPFDFAAMNNRAAGEAQGEILLFLNDDVEAQAEGWLERIAGVLERPEIGIAGALLTYPDGTIQHAGIVLGMADGTGHAGRHLMASRYWPWLRETRDVSAVTGACLAIHKRLFEQLGGFDSAFPVNYNDVDLCLRARQAGYRVVLEAGVNLIHREAASRVAGTSLEERVEFRRRWGALLAEGDPFFTPNLRLDAEDLSLSS